MVTKIRKPTPRRFYLREWRKTRAKPAVALAALLDIERESYYRLERNPHTLSIAEIDKLADALDIEPEQLWHPPNGPPSLDLLVSDASDDMRATVTDIVRRLIDGH